MQSRGVKMKIIFDNKRKMILGGKNYECGWMHNA